jgi:hypothetical protein
MVKKVRIIKGADGKDVEGRGFVAPAVEQTAQKVQTIMKDNLRRVK